MINPRYISNNPYFDDDKLSPITEKVKQEFAAKKKQ
jgi:hypothetical protein